MIRTTNLEATNMMMAVKKMKAVFFMIRDPSTQWTIYIAAGRNRAGQ